MNPDTRVCRRCIDAVEFWGVGQRPLALTVHSRHFWDVSETRPLRGWWQEADIDPVKAARKLWSYSRMDQGRVHRCRFDGNHWLMSDISLGGHSKFHQNDYKTIKSAAVRAAIRRQRPVAIVPIRPSRAHFMSGSSVSLPTRR